MTAQQNVRPGVTPHIPALTFSIEDLFQALTLIMGRDFNEAWRLVVLQLVANEAAEDVDDADGALAPVIIAAPVAAPIVATPVAAAIVAAPAAAHIVAAPAAAYVITAPVVAAPVAVPIVAALAAMPVIAPPVAAPAVAAPVAIPVTWQQNTSG